MHNDRLFVPAALLLAALVLLPVPATADDDKPSYPETKREDVTYELHGETIEDPYRWLEDDNAKDVEAWDNAQMAFTRKHLDAVEARAQISEQIAAELSLGGMRSLPTFEGGAVWFTYREKGANHARLYRVDMEAFESTPAEELLGKAEVILDPNTWSEDGTEGLNSWHPSPNGKLLAYRRDSKGSENATLYVLDLESGELLPDEIPRNKFSSPEWLPDSSGFIYKRNPDPDMVPKGEEQHHSRIHLHKLGTLPLDDPIIYGQGRPTIESKWVYRSSDEKSYFIGRGIPYQTVDVFQITWQPDGSIKLLPTLEGGEKDRSWVDAVGGTYLVNTDRFDGRRELFTMTRKADLSMSEWKPVPGFADDQATAEVDERSVPGVLDEHAIADDNLVVHMKHEVISQLWFQPLASTKLAAKEIPLPGPGSVSSLTTRAGDSRVWFRYESMSQPPTDFVVDTKDPKLALKEIQQLPTNANPAELVSKKVMYSSKDGTQVPLFIMHHKDTRLDGSAPTIVYGYGGFRVGLYPRFSRTRSIWARMGGVYCVACLRGGNEFGEAWHEGGALGNKQNVYDDFIGACEFLVKEGMARSEHVGIWGGSNGGLLTAVTVNQRPDLVAAGISGVPLTDMLRYHKFQYAKVWTKEYGDPDIAEEFAWIRPYSPYHNVKEGTAYPAMLVTAGLHDGRVNAFHARKMAAQWQWATSSSKPILLSIDRDSGHGAASLKQAQKQLTDQYAFMWKYLGEAK